MSCQGDAADPGAPCSDVLTVADPIGLLMARSAYKMKLTFHARGRCQYVFSMDVHTSNSPLALDTLGAPLLEDTTAVPAPSLEVLARGDFPVLSISDVR